LRPKFLADENFNQAIVDGLLRRELAIDLLAASDSGIAGLSDPEVLQIAAEARRIVLSHDRRTMAYFDRFIEQRMSSGLLVLSQRLDIGDAIEELLMIWVASDADEWQNQRRFLPL
jgi:predicted nuclease of predicted toxin-antitoxin system